MIKPLTDEERKIRDVIELLNPPVFEVGDFVEIREDVEILKTYFIFLNPVALQKTYRIESIDRFGHLQLEVVHYWFSSEQLRLVKKHNE